MSSRKKETYHDSSGLVYSSSFEHVSPGKLGLKVFPLLGNRRDTQIRHPGTWFFFSFSFFAKFE